MTIITNETRGQRLPDLCDTGQSQDIFCSELALIESLGICQRLYFPTSQGQLYGDKKMERVVTARLIVPTGIIPAMLGMLYDVEMPGLRETMDRQLRIVN